jgi:hypothetical protein
MPATFSCRNGGGGNEQKQCGETARHGRKKCRRRQGILTAWKVGIGEREGVLGESIPARNTIL